MIVIAFQKREYYFNNNIYHSSDISFFFKFTSIFLEGRPLQHLFQIFKGIGFSKCHKYDLRMPQIAGNGGKGF